MTKLVDLENQLKAGDGKPVLRPGDAIDPTFEAAKGGLQHFQHAKSPNGIATSLENSLVSVKLLRIRCRYDVFHDRIHVVTNLNDNEATSENYDGFDQIVLLLREQVILRWGFDPGKQFMEDALRLECLKHTFDPVREYLDGLRWDGVPRIDRWLTTYCHADDTELNRACGRKWLVAGVRRVRSPGVKFDEMLTLEGDQGQGKSSLFKILAGGDENFSDAEIIGCDKKEQQELVQGVWIYEIAELEGMTKHDVTSIKLFLSKTYDRARPAYARTRVDRPRRNVFGGTTNDNKYLRDATGNRRIWPIDLCGKGLIDLVGFARDRDQLWAEAAVIEASGEALTLAPTLWSVAAAEQQARLTYDPWEDEIRGILARLNEDKAKDGMYEVGINKHGQREWRVASSYLLGTWGLDLLVERQTNATTKRLAEVMRTLGWTKPANAIRVGKKVCQGYTKTINEPKLIERIEPAQIEAPKPNVEPKGKLIQLNLIRRLV